MTPFRRLASFATLAACLASPALHAEGWKPSQAVRIVVPIVGSTNDVIARLVAPHLQQALGQPFIVENKPGAGGNIGADFVAKSAPDGHTLLVGYNGPIAISKTLFDNLPYDPQRDFAPITLAVTSPQYLVVHPDLPATSVAEFVQHAKASPGKVSYASVALGSASHLTMEMLNEAAGIETVHIPYRGAAPALVDLVAGTVDAAFMVPGNVQQFMKDGRLRVLASSGRERFRGTPDVPTLIESGYPDFVATSWVGFLAPAGTPAPAIERYHAELTRILALPQVRQQLEELEFDVVATTPQAFAAWIDEEIDRWGTVIRDTGASSQ